MTTKTGRRGLWSQLLGKLEEAPQASGGFSLESFYSKREGDAEARAVPVVELRKGLPIIETTQVGVCPEIEPVIVFEGEGEAEAEGEA